VAEALALLALAAALFAAAARPAWLPEAIAAAAGALLLLAVGAISLTAARHALGDLAPTVAFLAALLVLGEGCRREGLFEALGGFMAAGAQGRHRRLFLLTFAAAAAVTVVLGLDATVVLLTPVVFATAARLRASPRPHLYACAHLANSASLLLVISNLTNLLAFHATGLSFTRFAVLMALPWAAAVAVEWFVLRRFFARELQGASAPAVREDAPRLPRFALAVLALTLVGFAISSAVSVAPVWFAAAGALAISLPGLARGTATPLALIRAVEPGFLVFVLGLGVIVATASDHGLHSAVRSVLPDGTSLPDLLAIAALSALLANLVNNLPATLILVPVAAALGTGPVLAVLVGVNVGPNLTYAGSLATLLWRRALRAEGTDVELAVFTRLGLLTVPPAIVLATVGVWLSTRVL
jgi:arsenical pump membrane protein